MVASISEEKTYTIDEYLAGEETAEYKSEYRNGKKHAMPGGTQKHNAITFNFSAALKFALKAKGKKCQGMSSDMKIQLPKYNHFVYPDCCIICEAPEFYNQRQDTILNPLVIIEVLSEATESYDRGKKFEKYRSLPSFKEYVLVAQNEPTIEVFYKKTESEDLWQIKKANGLDASIYLEAIDCNISLADVYDLIDFEKAEAAPSEEK